MATVPPPPAQKEPPSAPPATTALDNLQAMVNLVLIQSGRFLREQASGNTSGRNQNAIKRAVPAASDRFHASLDELENELHQAQAVLRRDLALLQADRQKREQAEAAERQRLAAESVVKQSAVPTEDPIPQVEEKSPVKAEDSIPTPAETSKPKTQPPALQRPESPPPPIKTDTTPTKERDPLFDGTPTTANAQDTEFDLDAIFGETVDHGGAENGNNDQQGDVNMEDLSFNLDDDGGGQSLLRGLEDFAKGGDDSGTATQPDTTIDLDFEMPDLPDLSVNESTSNKPVDSTATQQAVENTDSANMLDNMPDTLDDLFMDYENTGDMETSEFEKAFWLE